MNYGNKYLKDKLYWTVNSENIIEIKMKFEPKNQIFPGQSGQNPFSSLEKAYLRTGISLRKKRNTIKFIISKCENFF